MMWHALPCILFFFTGFLHSFFLFFFFNDTATTEIYTLSLHDALPICLQTCFPWVDGRGRRSGQDREGRGGEGDRKSTRLNSSHEWISYAVFCLKKKKKNQQKTILLQERTK